MKNDQEKPTVSSPTCTALLCASLEGNSDTYIVRETVKRLDKELKENGRDTFTIEDLRRIRSDIFST